MNHHSFFLSGLDNFTTTQKDNSRNTGKRTAEFINTCWKKKKPVLFVTAPASFENISYSSITLAVIENLFCCDFSVYIHRQEIDACCMTPQVHLFIIDSHVIRLAVFKNHFA